MELIRLKDLLERHANFQIDGDVRMVGECNLRSGDIITIRGNDYIVRLGGSYANAALEEIVYKKVLRDDGIYRDPSKV